MNKYYLLLILLLSLVTGCDFKKVETKVEKFTLEEVDKFIQEEIKELDKEN